jgi:peptidoglycan/xylan/chitin deacetylase (PgdA/CDA1 family)
MQSLKVKNAIKKSVELIAVQPFFVSLFQRLNKRKTIFIGYHGVSEDSEPYKAWTLVSKTNFRKQLQFLKENFNCIHIDGVFERKKKAVSRPNVVVTFDDGYANNAVIALPILEELKIPAIIYVTTRHVIERELFWPDIIWMLVKKAPVPFIDLSKIAPPLSSYQFSGDDNRFQISAMRLIEDIKKAESKHRKLILSKIICKFKKVSEKENLRFEVENNVFTPMTHEQVQQLSSHLLITIGAHSHCHNLLDQISLKQANESIRKSKEILTCLTGKSINHFAYPNGNYNSNLVEMVRKEGFNSAVTFSSGLHNHNDDQFTINRFGVGADMSIQTFKTMLTGLFELKRWLR